MVERRIYDIYVCEKKKSIKSLSSRRQNIFAFYAPNSPWIASCIATVQFQWQIIINCVWPFASPETINLLGSFPLECKYCIFHLLEMIESPTAKGTIKTKRNERRNTRIFSHATKTDCGTHQSGVYLAFLSLQWHETALSSNGIAI